MRSVLVGICIGLVITIGGYYLRRTVIQYVSHNATVSPLSKILEKPLEKYTILRLSEKSFLPSQIVFDEATATTSAYTVYAFHFLSDNKKVTGVAHLPAQADIPNDPTPRKKYPVIVQFRGYVDRQNYVPGEGTQRSAEVFAQNGFISLAPDFLGYGGSDMPSTDVFEERFETYTTALNLLASVKTLSIADASKVGIWGHSNGGQIALTALEISGQSLPTTLWAPVSKPFPYSILYYTDEADDHGKQLRKHLAAFEKDYDVELYSIPNYLDRISAPVQIHQGTADDAVPQAWSDELAKLLKGKDKDVTYSIYPGADHNMLSAWNIVVSRDIDFFRQHFR